MGRGDWEIFPQNRFFWIIFSVIHLNQKVHSSSQIFHWKSALLAHNIKGRMLFCFTLYSQLQVIFWFNPLMTSAKQTLGWASYFSLFAEFRNVDIIAIFVSASKVFMFLTVLTCLIAYFYENNTVNRRICAQFWFARINVLYFTIQKIQGKQ